jgi:hypothetical protein
MAKPLISEMMIGVVIFFLFNFTFLIIFVTYFLPQLMTSSSMDLGLSLLN